MVELVHTTTGAERSHNSRLHAGKPLEMHTTWLSPSVRPSDVVRACCSLNNIPDSNSVQKQEVFYSAEDQNAGVPHSKMERQPNELAGYI